MRRKRDAMLVYAIMALALAVLFDTAITLTTPGILSILGPRIGTMMATTAVVTLCAVIIKRGD